MDPEITGQTYDQIATVFHGTRSLSSYGLEHLRRAIRHAPGNGWALDAGCGAGVPITQHLVGAGFSVTGIDVSRGMLSIARGAVPEASFRVSDMTTFDEGRQYDLVVAWDSFFHVPYGSQREVLSHLCSLVAPSGVILFTAGGVDGETQGDMLGHTFYYSSLAEVSYLNLLRSMGLKCILMERDQCPDEHQVFIAGKGQ
jgi:SAM-dependent methyltransferase